MTALAFASPLDEPCWEDCRGLQRTAEDAEARKGCSPSAPSSSPTASERPGHRMRNASLSKPRLSGGISPGLATTRNGNWAGHELFTWTKTCWDLPFPLRLDWCFQRVRYSSATVTYTGPLLRWFSLAFFSVPVPPPSLGLLIPLCLAFPSRRASSCF